MAEQSLTQDDLVEVLRFRLGLPCKRDPQKAQELSNRIQTDRKLCKILDHACETLPVMTLGRAFQVTVQATPRVINANERALLDKLLEKFREWVRQDSAVAHQLNLYLKDIVKDGVKSHYASPTTPPGIPGLPQPAKQPPPPPPSPPRVLPPLHDPLAARRAPVPLPPLVPVAVATPGAQPAPNPEPSATFDMLRPQWNYIPAPADEPDPHSEFEERAGTSPQGHNIIGARVRGKKHKHDGTHCDDWFEFASAGEWTILVVSDGGGSYKFSRVGARAACESLVKVLRERLATHAIAPRETWDASSFAAPDITHVNDSLIAAFGAACDAVENAVTERLDNPDYERILGRKPVFKDFYCTLLAAVHITIPFGEGERSLIFGCAVGDGMVAAIDANSTARLLMTPDSGEQAGEVRFLDRKEVEPDRLRAKIFPCLCNLKSLLLMTDGVADDYFPNDPGMSILYGDLVLNGILPHGKVQRADVDIALQGTTVDSLPALTATFETYEGESLVGEAEPRKVRISTVASLAEKLGLPPEQLVQRAALLDFYATGAILEGSPEASTPAPVRARNWLDAYHVRGSFDDRTLVAMSK